jgi:hypothetical protein
VLHFSSALEAPGLLHKILAEPSVLALFGSKRPPEPSSARLWLVLPPRAQAAGAGGAPTAGGSAAGAGGRVLLAGQQLAEFLLCAAQSGGVHSVEIDLQNPSGTWQGGDVGLLARCGNASAQLLFSGAALSSVDPTSSPLASTYDAVLLDAHGAPQAVVAVQVKSFAPFACQLSPVFAPQVLPPAARLLTAADLSPLGSRALSAVAPLPHYGQGQARWRALLRKGDVVGFLKGGSTHLGFVWGLNTLQYPAVAHLLIVRAVQPLDFSEASYYVESSALVPLGAEAGAAVERSLGLAAGTLLGILPLMRPEGMLAPPLSNQREVSMEALPTMAMGCLPPIPWEALGGSPAPSAGALPPLPPLRDSAAIRSAIEGLQALDSLTNYLGGQGAVGVPGLVGLRNLGNTCFMNSALQVRI